jgi:hypothetical protein
MLGGMIIVVVSRVPSKEVVLIPVYPFSLAWRPFLPFDMAGGTESHHWHVVSTARTKVLDLSSQSEA